MSAFPELSTPRLRLRRIRPDDIGQVFAALSHPEVIRHYGVAFPTLDSTLIQMHWFEQILADGSGIWWGLCRHDDDTLLGACGICRQDAQSRTAELGYWLQRTHWGQGLMGEALPALFGHVFGAMQLHRLQAEVEPDNHASIALLERLGFEREGLLRECAWRGETPLSLLVYGLLRSDSGAARGLVADRRQG